MSDDCLFRCRSGKVMNILAPTPDMVDLYDIAHALANTCRYNGHTDRFYSVAEHSFVLSRIVPKEHAIAALLHDAAEAYLGDFIGPIHDRLFIADINGVRKLRSMHAVESNILRTVFFKYGVEIAHGLDPVHEVVRALDERLRVNETRDLFVGWTLPGEPIPDLNLRNDYRSDKDWKDLFIGRFKELGLTP